MTITVRCLLARWVMYFKETDFTLDMITFYMLHTVNNF